MPNGYITFTYGGGSIAIGSSGIGGIDPFPTYSVTSEPIRKDTTNLGIKYNVTVTGTLILSSGSALATTVQSIVTATGEIGTLTISGNNTGTLTFTDCIMVSSEAAQQDDTSRGTQNQDYTLSFEAYNLAGATNSEKNLTDFSESWETSVDDGTYSDNGTLTQTMFTITQTLSATGRAGGNSGTYAGKSGYIAAKEWVEGRVALNPISTVPLDLSKTQQQIALQLPAQYTAYNRTKQVTQDIAEGTYSVTVTWQASKNAATSTIEFTLDNDQTAEAQTVRVSVTINGLSSFDLNGGTINKYDNAKLFYASIAGQIDGWAATFYQNNGNSKPLNLVSASRTDNQTDGTITIDRTFDDKDLTAFPGASSVSLNITYTNEDGGNNIVAILPVIAKTNGPIIQNMQTTGERKRSIALDVTMNQANRISKPTSQAFSYIAKYEPKVNPLYRENMTETWNPVNGAYTLNLDYVWTDSPSSPPPSP